jgi:PAS domain S-box-containing protein
MGATTERSDGRLFALSETMRAFAEATVDLQRLVRIVAERVAQLIGDGCSLALLSEDQQRLSVVAVHFRDPEQTALAQRVLGDKTLDIDRSVLGGQVIRSRRGLILPRIDLASLQKTCPSEALEMIRALNVGSLMSVPLQSGDHLLGILSLMRVGDGIVPYNEDDQAMARNLAEHAALALSNAQLLRKLQDELQERMRAQEQASRFVSLIQNSDEFIATAALDGRVLFINDGGRRMLGIAPGEDLSTLRLSDFHTDDGMKRGEILRAHGRWRGQGQLRHMRTRELIDTQVSSFLMRDADGQPFGFATVQHDMRETKRLEAQLKQAQKMEAIGTLAGGIAHDFNNILGAILGNVELARMAVGPDHPVLEELGEIGQAGRRATGLIKQILAFSRRRETTKRVVRLGEVVHEVAGLLRSTMSSNVDLTISTGEPTPHILADANQIHQILLNLCTNAWQALEGMPGRIEVVLDTVVVDGASSSVGDGAAPGRYARLWVSDNGKGMDDATLERIFDPFFTTKEPGVGTGLGLSVVHGIVKDHNGTISVTSTRGRGATFAILFPEHAGEADPAEPRSRELFRGHGQHLMFLDDEESLVRLAQRLLERIGYRVTGFSSAEAALEAVRDDPSRFDLAITDFNMPGISGIQVAKLLGMIRPDLPVILSSGNISDDLRESAARAGVDHVLHKPSTAEELAEAIHRCLA